MRRWWGGTDLLIVPSSARPRYSRPVHQPGELQTRRSAFSSNPLSILSPSAQKNGAQITGTLLRPEQRRRHAAFEIGGKRARCSKCSPTVKTESGSRGKRIRADGRRKQMCRALLQRSLATVQMTRRQHRGQQQHRRRRLQQQRRPAAALLGC